VELRVALVLKDVYSRISLGQTVFVQTDSGNGAGYSDEDYVKAGATISCGSCIDN